MAAPRTGWPLPSRSSWVGLCCLVAGSLAVAGLELPSQDAINSVASSVAKELTLLTEEATGRDNLENKYNEQNFFLEPVHGDDALDEAIEKLGPIFQQRIKAVQEIAKRAEQLASIHQTDEELTAQRVSFINGLAKEWDDGTIRNDSLVSLPQFPRATRLNVNSSAIRFPTHVYEGWMWHKFKPLWWEDVETLNALMWTDGLDATFIENMRRDPTLHWQYFATRDGMLRYFPAHKWRISTNHPDSYDARQRPWFTQSLSSAKDLIILVDVSGSIHGPTFEILKISVKRLLGTLTEFDYFNVFQFNETATWLVPCFETLVPASTHNKRMVYQALDHIVPHGKASWANALAFTYQQLVKFQNLRSASGANRGGSSNCHQAIVLISDGGTEFPQEQLELIRNDSRLPMTRVFTLAVGPHPIPTTNMRNISCFAHGLHAAVINYGAIPNKVRNYLQVLNRPLALSRDESLIDWSLSYPDAAGLGTVLTVSKPVYNLDPNGSQSILGVAAVDIPTSLFDLALPDSQLGFAGYKMVITPAGNAVVHPKLHLQVAYMDDPLMVNFEDLEPPGNWTDPVRRMIVDRRNGSQSFTVSQFVDNARYLVDQKRTWFYKPIAKSAYTLAVSVVNGTNLIVPNVELLHKVPWNSSLLTRAAPWNFCSHLTQNYSSPKEYLNQLSVRYERDGTGCDHTALGHLLWDLEMTANVSHLWNNDPRFSSRFISTLGGISRIERPSSLYLQKDLLDPRNSSVFLRLVHSDAKFLISPPAQQEGRDNFLVAAKVVAKGQLMALVGSSVTKEAVQSLWSKVTGTSFRSSDHVHVYWLDEGAHVIASNQMEVHPGTFIGSKLADPQLMKALLAENPYPSPLYRQLTVAQQSTDCPVPPKMPVSGASFLSAKWPRNLFRALTGAANLIWAFLASLVTATSATSATHVELELDQLRPPKVGTFLCTKNYVAYQLQALEGAPSRSFACSSLCSSNQTDQEAFVRTIRIAQVPDTRSILVASTAPCQCPLPLFQHGLLEVEDQMSKCHLPNRYRKSTKPCHSRDSREKSLECGCQSFYSGRMLFPSMMFTFFIVWILR